MGAKLKRTILKASPEAQALLGILATCGQFGYEVAKALQAAGWDYDAAARMLMLNAESVRQRVHRMIQRVETQLKSEFVVTIRRRAKIRYGTMRVMYDKVQAEGPRPDEEAMEREELVRRMRSQRKGLRQA